MLKKFKMAWRVSDSIWSNEESFKGLIAMFKTHEDIADEIMLIINEPSNFVFDPLPRVAKMVDIFKDRSEVLKSMGFIVGINFWPTFGSGASFEKSPLRPAMPFRPVVGMDGTIDDSIACPLSPEFLTYTREKYKIAAKAAPTFIWVDDDTRFTHLNSAIPYPCFCEHCVNGFEDGLFSNREELVTALNTPVNKQLRHSWSSYGADRLAKYCTEVRSAVDSVDPLIDIPFMTVGPTHTTYSGDFIEKCMSVLRSKRGRPGHGFYWDDRPEGMLHKVLEVGRQIKRYPDYTIDVLYEEESYPCAYLDKAVRTRLNEVWLALAAGCNGVAFNHLPFACETGRADMFNVYLGEMDAIHEQRPAWSKYVEFTKDLKWQGFWPADNAFLMAGMDCSEGWFKENNPDYAVDKPDQVGQMGIPLTTDFKAACGTILAGKVIETLSDEVIMEIFSKGVLMDVEALKILAARGLERLAGVTAGNTTTFGRERFTNHKFNGPYEVYERFGIFDPGYELHPMDDKVEVLAVSVDAYNVVYGPCLTAYVNELGGKVVVCGYSPWRFLGHPSKLWQLRSLSDWMGGPMSLRFVNEANISRIAPFIRGDGNRAAVLLINASLDASKPCDLLLRGCMNRAWILNNDGSRSELLAIRESEFLCVTLPIIQPWYPLIVLSE